MYIFSDPCDKINCGFGSCQAEQHQAVCYCQQSFRLATDGTCRDVNECLDNPCHRTAICRNSVGGYTCTCISGLIGDPYSTGCRRPGECTSDNQCPTSSVCHENKCKNPCDITQCGSRAVCNVVGRSPVCSCPPRSSGDPTKQCVAFECTDSSECSSDKSCVNNRCINPCSVPGVCGLNTECKVQSHVQLCSCKAGFTGDPNLGCSQISYCGSETDCPSGERCQGGVCVRKFMK